MTGLSESYPIARRLLAEILVSDVFGELLSKNMINDLTDRISYCMANPWRSPRIDAFIHSFFLEHLPSSRKLQSVFRIDTHSPLVSLFLKNRSTQFERVAQLIDKFDKTFLFHEAVQRIALHSRQHRQRIDQLIADEKCVTGDKLFNEDIHLQSETTSTTNIKFPGLHVNLLCSSFSHLTGHEQERITKIILHDFVQVDCRLTKRSSTTVFSSRLRM